MMSSFDPLVILKEIMRGEKVPKGSLWKEPEWEVKTTYSLGEITGFFIELRASNGVLGLGRRGTMRRWFVVVDYMRWHASELSDIVVNELARAAEALWALVFAPLPTFRIATRGAKRLTSRKAA